LIDLPSVRKLMTMDACVLIDFFKADRTILQFVVKYVGPLYVTSPVVDEVNDIDDEKELIELGVDIIEPDIEDAYAAASQTGPTSFQDQLCFLLAKRRSLTCVTNDKPLRKLCAQEGIPVLWGLELLAELHNAKGISGQKAKVIAQVIQKANLKYIDSKIVARFNEIIDRQEIKHSI